MDKYFSFRKFFIGNCSQTTARGAYKLKCRLSLEYLQMTVLFKMFNIKNLMWHFFSQN